MKLTKNIFSCVFTVSCDFAFLLNRKKTKGMVNTTLLFLALLLNSLSFAQTFKPFTIRHSAELKGDMLVIGNNILGQNNNPLNNTTLANESVSMQYIDIDSDPTTFSSSSANLAVPNTVSCFRIAYAGLYWGALIKTGDSRTDINKVKFKTPGSTTYTDITGQLIYDAVVAPIVPDQNKPYACYADVTTIISGLTNAQGTYTVANVKSSLGLNGVTGLAAGWTLYVIYEDPETTTKFMVSYDGFTALYDGRTLDIPITGFLTPPAGAINLKFGFATLNGDKSPNGRNQTKVEISNGVANGTSLVTNLRSSNYFFNSSITNLDAYLNARNPNGTNTLGYDTGVEQLTNVNNSTVDHNATSAQITLQVARGQANPIFSFFNAFQVNVIAPVIKLTKLVKDITGNNIGDTEVGLGTNLYYEIGFQNIGNDNVTNFTLKDVLPENIIFNYPADIISLPAGVTHTYDPATRILLFNIPDDLVEIADIGQTIRLHVQVVPSYTQLKDACSNEIKNQAFATYKGVVNTKLVQDEGSFASLVCNFGTPSSTNFIVNIDGQTFSKNEVLCGASVILSAPNGYDTYSWSRNPSGTPVIGTNQTYTATETGTYYVVSSSPCATITEEITVLPFGNTITNPIIPYADEVVICPNNGKELPNIFLCGANATRYIPTNISDASSIEWEKLNENSCPSVTIPDCANENPSCQWNVVGTGPNFLINTAGQFRITLRYPGGCFSRFYFNVYQNLLSPTVTTRDIICTSNGQITVGGVPTGYEYSLDGNTYQSSNIFSIATAGAYNVYIRQIGVPTNPCVFSVVNVLIRQRNFAGSTIVSQPLCNGDKGTIKIGASDAYPQYYYSLYDGATLINSVGPLLTSDYEFSGLNPGIYTARVWTDDGCDFSTSIEIIEPAVLTATSAITKPLTCEEGEIMVYPLGGTAPYSYYLNGSTTAQSFPQFPVNNSGIYNIEVVDSNDCRATTTINVNQIPPPIYTIDKIDMDCFGTNSGGIFFNVSNANGYTIAFSIDNGNTYTTNPTFSNLSAGSYSAIIKYSLAGTDCFTAAQNIIITQPTTALIANALVTEFAGCGPNGEGKVAIINPQGGTPFPAQNPYLYSFDNQLSWNTSNETYLMPGTYTVYIKDANDCIYAMNITLEPQALAPTVSIEDPIFNCDGTATVTATITNSGSGNFTYEYLLDNVVNSNIPANIFINVPPGNHIISIKYSQVSTTNPPPISCTVQKDFPIIIANDEAFIASITAMQNVGCSGAADGKITIAADNFNLADGFQYSMNSGTTWNTQLTSPYTVTGLSAGTYNVLIRYNSTSTGTCIKSFSQTITQPSPLVTTASVTVPASCISGATISVTTNGGTPAYRYELWDSSLTTNLFPSQNSNTFTNIPVGSYIVRSFDANNCAANSNVVDIIAPPLLAATLDANSDLCFDSINQATLIVDVSGGTAPFVYSLDGAPAQNSNIFNNVGVGSHTIVVTDSYNCTATLNNVTIAPQLNAAISSIKELDCTSSPDAIITGTVSGGYPPYIVTLVSGPGPGTIAQPTSNTFTYTTAVATTYNFQIQDAKGCIATTTATINSLVPITATLNAINPLCNGDSNGSVQIIASGGAGSYTYSIDGTTYVSTSEFTGLASGNYIFYIKDAKDCIITRTITLTAPSTLTTFATVVPFSCSNTNTKQSATITIAVPTTGTTPYQYSFNGGGYTNINSLTVSDNGTDQTIPYSVKDANGCTFSDSVTLNKLDPPTDLSFTSTPITCSATTATVTISSTNGVGTLIYEILLPSSAAISNTTGIFNGLLPDTYIFKVTDANGCYYSESYNIAPVTPLAVAANQTSDVLCYGESSGSIAFLVSGFSGTYSYIFNGEPSVSGQSAPTIVKSNLPAGTYPITLIDEVTACSASTLLTITQPIAPLSLFLSSNSNANCNVPNSKVTVTASGGTPNYSYSFVQDGAAAGSYSPSNTADLNPTVNPNWDVYVKDANGCIFKLDITITKDPAPTVTATVINQCSSNGSSYSIVALGSSGVGPLTYSIGSGFQSSPNFSVTTPGTYTVTVKDSNNCIATTTVTVYPVLTAVAILTKDLTCSIPTEATISINGTGGLGSYTYKVSNDGGVTYSNLDFIGNIFTTAFPGTYQFLITDGNGCTKVSNSVTINPIIYPVITSTIQTQQIFCNGDNTGSIKVNIDSSKGIGPFLYSIDGTNFQSSNTFTGLTAGTFAVTLKDSKGCTDTDNIIINEPSPITVNYHVVDITCNILTGQSKGSIIIDSVTGGNPNYNYFVTGSNGYNDFEINNGGTASVTFDIVDFGLYQINVVDANGCSELIQNIKVASPPDDLNIQITTTADCLSGGTADILLEGSLIGAGPFYFSIYTGSGLTYPGPTWIPEDAPGSKKASFTGLIPGVTYTFVVYDNISGCYYYETADAPVPTNSDLLISNLILHNITCTGENDGKVSFDIVSPYPITTDVTFEIYNSQSLISTGITGSGTVPANGILQITNLGGTLGFGNYFILVKEIVGPNLGCSYASQPFNITESAKELSITATVIKNGNCNEDGIVSAQAKDGTASYLFLISTSATPPLETDPSWIASSTFSVSAGDYYVYVKDAYGCIKSSTIQTVLLDPSPEITLTVTDDCADEGTFEITVNETVAGVAPYSISINGSAFQNVGGLPYIINNLNSGTYSITIKDINGCTDTKTVILSRKLSVNPQITKELDCTVLPDAEITLNISDGLSPFTYEISTDGGLNYSLPSLPSPGPTIIYSTDTAGTYTFRVTDSNGCQFITSAIIEPIIIPTFTFVQTNETCIDSDDGTITLTPTAGNGPFIFSIDNGNTFQSSNVFTGLSASGIYSLIVRDNKSCDSAPQNATITEPTAVSGTGILTQGLTCGAGNTPQAAIVTISGSGGTGPYTYSYNGGTSYTSANTFTTYSPGIVSTMVKDSNGCISDNPIDVNIPALVPPSDLTFVTTTPVTCLTNATVEVTGVTGGVAPLLYETIAPSPILIGPQTTTTFSGLTPGTYLFLVTDANGCIYQESYNVDPVTNITASGQLLKDVSCNGGSDGEIQFTIANFGGTYSYSIDGGSTVFAGQTNSIITLSGLPIGPQTILITDESTGCTATETITVSEPTLISLTETTNINANCNFGAQVSVIASGGILPYSYSFVPGGNTPASTDYKTSNSAVLDPIVSTTWDVWVKDNNGCVIANPLAIIIATDPLPNVTVEPYSQCPTGAGEYTFTLTPTGVGPFEYSIGSGFQSSPTFTVNIPGTYDVTVKDINECTTTVNSLINILPPLVLEPLITALPSCADGDGALTLNATGGSGSYEYSLDGGTPQSTADFTSIFAGTHAAIVTDITTGCTFSISVNLQAATPITGFTVSKKDVNCNGGNDGLIIASIDTPVSGINDNPIYTYSIDGGATTQTSNIFGGLPAGTYNVIVTSGRGCTAIQGITINEPAIIDVPAPVVNQFGCLPGTNGTNYATIIANGVTGGSGIYNYEFIKGGTVIQFGPSNIYTEADLLGGTYTVKIYDDKGCTGTAPAAVTINPFISLDKINVSINFAITCARNEDITVSVSSTGGNPSIINYSIVDDLGGVLGSTYTGANTTGIFTDLPVGNYLITATNPDTGCSIQSTHYVYNPDTFELKINSTTEVSCFGGNNGSVSVTIIDLVPLPTDESGPFKYSILDPIGNLIIAGSSPNAGPLVINNLAAGNYTISATLISSPECTASTNFSIKQPSTALTISETHTPITCLPGNNDGTISVSATGGWPNNYQFELVGPVNVAYSSQNYFENLTAGTYTINVRDTYGCIETTTVNLVIPPPITFTATSDINMLSCFGDTNSTITISNVTGGQGSNYTYTLNMLSPTTTSSGPQLSPVFSGLGVGTYTVTVADGFNCSAVSNQITIDQPDQIISSLVVATTQTCLNLTNLTLSATGGTGLYTYSNDPAFSNILGSFASSVTISVPVGNYKYYVKDANGCFANVSNSIKIDPLEPLIINLDLTNATVNCKGDSSGVILAEAQGGLGNYIYTLLDASGLPIIPTPTQLSPGNFSGLVAGTYFVKVDSDDCTYTSPLITITEPLLPVTANYVTTDLTCNGANNGVVTINSSGGTGTIQYAISPNLDQFVNDNTFIDLAPGNYNVIVQDALGCFIILNFDITEPNLLAVGTVPNSIIPEICTGDLDGAFSITISGGTAPYSVSLDNPSGPFSTGTANQTDFDFNGVSGGEHIVYIVDDLGCTTTWTVQLPESVTLNPLVNINYDCVNNVPVNEISVSVDASITNPADVDFALDGGIYQSSNTFTNIIPGTHFITARHTNGCEQRTLDFVIAQIDPLALVLNEGGLNEIVATASGGFGNYQYTLNGESYGSTSNFIIYKSGDYTVTVTDANGCTATASGFFNYIDVCIPDHFTPNGDGIEDGWAPGCTTNYKNLTFDIFDRYGRLIATYRLGEYWDGKYNGKELPTGDYWYVLRLNDVKDPREFVGHFTLYR